MNKNEKTDIVVKVNQLLNQLNNSTDSGKLKSVIQTSYAAINKPEKVSKQYKEISEALSAIVILSEELAIHKEYQFSKEQNEILKQMTDISRKTLSQSLIGMINGAVWHN